MKAKKSTDPASILETLDISAIQNRLAEMDSEARALRVFLRAARARQRQIVSSPKGKGKERRYAD
jgi:hypothetical protein